MAHNFVGGVADESHGTLVPHIDPAVNIDTEDGGISGIDELGILALLSEASVRVAKKGENFR